MSCSTTQTKECLCVCCKHKSLQDRLAQVRRQYDGRTRCTYRIGSAFLVSGRRRTKQKPCSLLPSVRALVLAYRGCHAVDGDYEIRACFNICGRCKVSRIRGRRVCEKKGSLADVTDSWANEYRRWQSISRNAACQAKKFVHSQGSPGPNAGSSS
jgi:hypothetical protein